MFMGQTVPLFKFGLSANVGINLNILIPFDEFAIPLNAVVSLGADLQVGATGRW